MLGFLFADDDGDQGRRVDGDHFGKPKSSYKSSWLDESFAVRFAALRRTDSIKADKLASASSGVTNLLGMRRLALNSRRADTTISVVVVPNSAARRCVVVNAPSSLRMLSCLRVLAGIQELLARSARVVDMKVLAKGLGRDETRTLPGAPAPRAAPRRPLPPGSRRSRPPPRGALPSRRSPPPPKAQAGSPVLRLAPASAHIRA